MKEFDNPFLKNSGNYIDYNNYSNSSAGELATTTSDPNSIAEMMGNLIPVNAEEPPIIFNYQSTGRHS